MNCITVCSNADSRELSQSLTVSVHGSNLVRCLCILFVCSMRFLVLCSTKDSSSATDETGVVFHWLLQRINLSLTFFTLNLLGADMWSAAVCTNWLTFTASQSSFVVSNKTVLALDGCALFAAKFCNVWLY